MAVMWKWSAMGRPWVVLHGNEAREEEERLRCRSY